MKIMYLGELRRIYTKIEEAYETKRNELGMDEWDDEHFDEFLAEEDGSGYLKHVTCDEIWCMLNYVAERHPIYTIAFSFSGTRFEFEFNSENRDLQMMIVNMLWCLWELEEKIELDCENIHEINKKIDF